jgi:uncharacterized damage-inducible protein DinB
MVLVAEEVYLDNFTKHILWQQFGASIDALEQTIEMCPDDVWSRPSEQLETWEGYWHMVYHTLRWLDFYLHGSREGFAQPAPFNHAEFDPKKQIYSKAELHTYLRYCRQKCHITIQALTAESAQRMCSFEWLGEISFAELLLYNMRHVQHHAAQLNLILRQEINNAPDWVSRAKT